VGRCALEEERAELEAVLASESFSRAPALSRLLTYVCGQYLAGRGEFLKEYTVGIEALGRGPNFDPDHDSVVRVMATRLRKRLAAYYAEEGAGHKLRIQLPESGYSPKFVRNPAVAGSVKLPGIEEAVKAGGFLAGTAAEIIEQLKAVEKRYPGIDRVICATPLGTPLDVQLEDLDRFAKEVMPAFRTAKVAAAAE
jgi:hypothetical protein